MRRPTLTHYAALLQEEASRRVNVHRCSFPERISTELHGRCVRKGIHIVLYHSGSEPKPILRPIGVLNEDQTGRHNGTESPGPTATAVRYSWLSCDTPCSLIMA